MPIISSSCQETGATFPEQSWKCFYHMFVASLLAFSPKQCNVLMYVWCNIMVFILKSSTQIILVKVFRVPEEHLLNLVR